MEIVHFHYMIAWLPEKSIEQPHSQGAETSPFSMTIFLISSLAVFICQMGLGCNAQIEGLDHRESCPFARDLQSPNNPTGHDVSCCNRF